VLVFFNFLQTHAVSYLEPNSSSVLGRLSFPLSPGRITDVWRSAAFHRARCGERGCEVHPHLRQCFYSDPAAATSVAR